MTTPDARRTKRCLACRDNNVYSKRCGLRHVDPRLLTLGDYVEYHSNLGHHKSLYYCEVRAFCRAWNRDLPKACQQCGYSMHVDLCHVKALAGLPLETTLAEANDPTNIVVLCKNHHWELDHDLLSIENIPPRQATFT